MAPPLRPLPYREVKRRLEAAGFAVYAQRVDFRLLLVYLVGNKAPPRLRPHGGDAHIYEAPF
ncbi:hypothetical protein TO73_2870 (plasmid) [Thermus aquaticus Y51MC23]|uniref:YcfA-like protein n=1 Tax=Thermus aquaticus (strain ATCC BAA-2747 / Y51MC23) TaxID=498848 RepID=A0ABN4IN46_THEA5|nr:hypothetical protein TO73_2870 [Thermus aquaticus Y51MC23]